MYLLDSNAWIAIFRNKSSRILEALKQRPADQIVLCSVVLAELWYGVRRSAASHRLDNQRLVEDLQNRYKSLPLDDRAAIESAQMRAELVSVGQTIGPYDLLIAAIAKTNELTLITHNIQEFSRIPNLKMEDWQ
jgi:tRNA(fMet)-specific endonuclease VapC